MEWAEVRVSVAPDLVEGTAQMLVDAGSSGVEIKTPADAGEVEVAPGELQVLAYFPRDELWDLARMRIHQGLQRVKRAFPGQRCRLATRTVCEEDWSCQWRRFFRVQHPLPRLVIKPTWESYRPVSGEIVLEMDPGMAFGTGTHPTTILCMQLLQDLLRGGEIVVDVGTGSGILALAAAHMGARRVLARDNDPVALRVARENVSRNGLEELVTVEYGDLLQDLEAGVDLIVANISRAAGQELLREARPVLASGGRVVLGGILNRHRRELERAGEKEGLVPNRAGSAPPWVALVFQRDDINPGVKRQNASNR